MLLKVLHHELHHHAEELVVTVEELSERTELFVHQTFGEKNANEALANADGVDRSLWFLGQSRGNHPVADRLAAYVPEIDAADRAALSAWLHPFLTAFCSAQAGHYANFDFFRREPGLGSPPKPPGPPTGLPNKQEKRVGAADESDYWTGVPWWFQSHVWSVAPKTASAPARPAGGLRTHAVSMDQARNSYGELDELSMVYLPVDQKAFPLTRFLKLFGYLNYIALGNPRWR